MHKRQPLNTVSSMSVPTQRETTSAEMAKSICLGYIPNVISLHSRIKDKHVKTIAETMTSRHTIIDKCKCADKRTDDQTNIQS